MSANIVQRSRDLFRSVESGDFSKFRKALEQGGNPNTLMEPEGICTMHMLAADDSDNAAQMLTKLLLEHGGNPNVVSLDGQTPVHLSAAWGNAAALKLLLKHGGDPTICDEDGCDALRMAAVNQQRKLVAMLSDHQRKRGKGDGLGKFESSDWDSSFLSCSMRTVPTHATSTEASFRSALSGGTIASERDTTSTTTIDNCSWYTVDEFLCVDDRANLAFLEQHLSGPSSSSGESSGSSSNSEHPSVVTEIYRCSGEGDSSDATIVSSASSVPSEIARMRDSVVFRELRRLGQSPGPVTPTTRRVYVQQLKRALQEPTPAKPAANVKAKVYSGPLRHAIRGNDVANGSTNVLESDVALEFASSDGRLRWRGGVAKCCFNYLLMDPRILCNLPYRSSKMSPAQCLSTFVDAIFYVGKGKQSRPYDHFYEALRSRNGACRIRRSKKIDKICEIWDAGFGVVSFHCFQGTIAAEALTREACMIDAIGVANLTNEKSGEYYGLASKCIRNDKCQLGTSFLKRALQIFLLEGERQIHAINTGFQIP